MPKKKKHQYNSFCSDFTLIDFLKFILLVTNSEQIFLKKAFYSLHSPIVFGFFFGSLCSGGCLLRKTKATHLRVQMAKFLRLS